MTPLALLHRLQAGRKVLGVALLVEQGGRGLSSMGGILAETDYSLPLG